MHELKKHPALIQLFASRLKNMTKEGDHYLALCPFHNDRNHPNLNIGKDDKGEYTYFCFACNASGDAIKFIQEVDKVSFTKALKIAEDAVGGDWEDLKEQSDSAFHKLESQDKAEEVPLERYVKFEIGLYESKEAQDWLFTERGITYDAAKACRFGFCQHLDSVTKKYNKEELKDIADKGWITFAAIDGDKVLCIEARSIVKKVTRIRTGMTNKVLFGIDNVSWEDPIYVVEGKLDMAIMVQAGFKCVSLPNASATIPPEMRDRLTQASAIILAGDNDGGAGSAKMLKLLNEFQSRTYLIKWPNCKDANEMFLKVSKRDVESFRKTVENLTLEAYANPSPGIRSLHDILKNNESDSSENRQDRFRFSIKALDSMANILPGSVVYLTANSTGAGKTQIVLQETLKAALKNDMVVLNYQTQLQGEEIGEIVTANLLAKERGDITKEDRQKASKKLKDCQYYIGNDPNATGMEGSLDLIEAGIRRVGANVVVLDLFHDICQGESDEIRAQARAMRRFKLMMQKYLAIGIVIGQPRKINPKDQEKDKPLTIYDLAKGSEAIVSESDVIFYMHRKTNKNMTEETLDRLSPEVDFYRMKGRNQGKGGALAKLFFLGKIATFREIIPVTEPAVQNSFDY